MPYHLFCNAAHDEVFEATFPLGAYDDEIKLGGYLQNLVSRIAFEDERRYLHAQFFTFLYDFFNNGVSHFEELLPHDV